MTLEEFRTTLTLAMPPRELSPPLTALWHDARGEWDAAHRVAQDLDDGTGAWIHAYLHRKEGDLDNAAYWYRRAGRPVASDALEAEWERLARAYVDD
jgi:hypothetical protein